MGSRRSKHFILSAVAMLGVELVAGQEEVADTTTAYSGGFTTSVPENQEGNSARLQRENLPGKAKTADEIQRLRKPRNYRELPPEQQEETPIDTARTRKKTEEAEEETPSDPLWKKPWFRNTMIGIALAAVAVLLWFLFAGTLGLRNQGKGRSTGFEDETAPEVDLGTDYHSLALRAEQEGDLRAALRFRFLELLRNLHLKGWIKLEPGKTNRQYLREVEPFAQLDRCRALTRAYERAWFGRILPEASEYKTLASAVETLIQRMERRPL
jgi:hypothetical protein